MHNLFVKIYINIPIHRTLFPNPFGAADRTLAIHTYRYIDNRRARTRRKRERSLVHGVARPVSRAPFHGGESVLVARQASGLLLLPRWKKRAFLVSSLLNHLDCNRAPAITTAKNTCYGLHALATPPLSLSPPPFLLPGV